MIRNPSPNGTKPAPGSGPLPQLNPEIAKWFQDREGRRKVVAYHYYAGRPDARLDTHREPGPRRENRHPASSTTYPPTRQPKQGGRIRARESQRSAWARRNRAGSAQKSRRVT